MLVIGVKRIYYTLIPSRFPPIALFKRVANDRDAEVAELESLTNPRLREKQRLLNGVSSVDVESPLVQNWNHAPFTYLNPEGTRFFAPERPVLELADELQTALAISIRKRETFLHRTKESSIALDMRVLSRRVEGSFMDASGLESGLTREERFSLGAEVVAAGLDGLVFRPTERPTANCVSILNGATLGRAVQGDHFRFVWDGKRIDAVYSFSSGKTYSPDSLGTPELVLAA